MGVPSNSLGVARASIQFDLSQLQAGVAAARQAGAQMQAALGQVSIGTRGAQTGVAGLSSELGMLGRAAGIAGGIMGAMQLARFALAADTTATAYRRQSVAALSLAGSQGKLNDLLSTYDRVTGGVVDKAQAMADVTKLQAIGFADTTAELERFTTAARGISVGMGRDQSYVISQLQLEMTSQRGMRLDQIGLGIAEVRNKAKQLQDADSSLTKEMAYQNAVLDVAIGKFGKLARSTEAQATGQEQAAKAWKNFALSVGDALGPTTSGILQGVADKINDISAGLQGVTDKAREAGKAIDEMRGVKSGDTTSLVTRGIGAVGISGLTAPSTIGGIIGGYIGDSLKASGLKQGLSDMFAAQMTPSLRTVTKINSDISGAESIRGMIQTNRSRLQNELESGTSSRSSTEINAEMARQDALLKQVNAQLAQFRGELGRAGSAALTGDLGDSSRWNRGPAAIDPNLEKQQADMVAWSESVQKIETDAGQARLDATQQYESSRSESVFSYEQGIAREEQDFGISRVRQAADLADNIARIGLDSARQAEKWAEDLAISIAKAEADSGKRVADAQETSAKRINEINEQYAKNRQRAERDHKDNLLDAAANLDAKAVWQEQRNFARSNQNAQEAHDDAISKEKENLAERTQKEAENLAERIKQDQEANAKRLADAKEADALRIQDAKDALVKQQAQEDQDRALRLQRGAEDQAHQLAQMAIAQGERMAQIDKHAAEERTALDADFLKQLNDDGLRNAKWYAQQEALKALALKQFDDWWLHILGAFGKVQGPPSLEDKNRFIDPAKLKGFASGGMIDRTGPIYAHAGEYMLNKNVVDRMGGYAGVQQMAMAGGRGGATLTLHPGAIAIHQLPGQNSQDLAMQVRGVILDVFNNELQ